MQKSLRLRIKGGLRERVKGFTTFEARTDFRRLLVSVLLHTFAYSFGNLASLGSRALSDFWTPLPPTPNRGHGQPVRLEMAGGCGGGQRC
jgi:hypothetical protein